MRIIHDIDEPVQMTATAEPYSSADGKWNGAAVKLTLVEEFSGNPIYIEGNSAFLIPALEEALQLVRAIVEVTKEQWENSK